MNCQEPWLPVTKPLLTMTKRALLTTIAKQNREHENNKSKPPNNHHSGKIPSVNPYEPPVHHCSSLFTIPMSHHFLLLMTYPRLRPNLRRAFGQSPAFQGAAHIHHLTTRVTRAVGEPGNGENPPGFLLIDFDRKAWECIAFAWFFWFRKAALNVFG